MLEFALNPNLRPPSALPKMNDPSNEEVPIELDTTKPDAVSAKPEIDQAFELWKERRAQGKESFGQFFIQAAVLVACLAVLILFVQFRNDARLSLPVKIGTGIGLTLGLSTLFAALKWFVNEKKFKLATKLGRMPKESDVLGKAGNINIDNRYVYIGFGLLFFIPFIYLIYSFLRFQ